MRGIPSPPRNERSAWPLPGRALRICLVVLACTWSVPAGTLGQAPPSPPDQPAFGPGGWLYPHQGVVTNGPYYPAWHPDQKQYEYYIFEPDDPRPDMAPVILFIHGYIAYNPVSYGEWIAHMVRKGYIVVWVRYDTGFTAPWGYARYVEAAWKDALKRLDTYWWEDHVLPKRDENWEIMTAFVGHSAGGYLAAIVAAKGASDPDCPYPAPYALVCIEPGGLGVIPKADFSRIDPGTKLLLLVADEDDKVCKSTAQSLWERTPQIPDENKDFLLYLSDRHGEPQQLANHFFPNTTGFGDTAAVDARDFYITYKLSVGLLHCAFEGRDCTVALGHGSPEQVGMGEWSDGVPVQPMVWVPDPLGLETTCQDKFEELPVWGASQAQAADGGARSPGDRSPSWNWLLSLGFVFLFLALRARRTRKGDIR